MTKLPWDRSAVVTDGEPSTKTKRRMALVVAMVGLAGAGAVAAVAVSIGNDDETLQVTAPTGFIPEVFTCDDEQVDGDLQPDPARLRQVLDDAANAGLEHPANEDTLAYYDAEALQRTVEQDGELPTDPAELEALIDEGVLGPDRGGEAALLTHAFESEVPTRFGGLYLDQEAPGMLVLQLTDVSDDDIALACTLGNPPGLRIESVEFTRADLAASHDAVLATGTYRPSEQGIVAFSSTDVVGNRVMLGIFADDEAELTEADLDRLAETIAAEAGVPRDHLHLYPLTERPAPDLPSRPSLNTVQFRCVE